MSNQIVRSEELMELENVELQKLIAYYRKFFTPTQIECLIMLWYGWDAQDVATELYLDISVIYEWMQDKSFSLAIESGRGKREEIVELSLEKSTLKAVRLVDNVLSMDLSPDDKGFGEILKLAKWLIDKHGTPDYMNTGESGYQARFDESTAKLIAEELKKAGGNTADIDISTLYREEDEVIEGEVIDPTIYYRIVEEKSAFVEPNIVNVWFDSEEKGYVFQCHACGKWYKSLARHVSGRYHPNTSLRDYRKHYGVPDYIPLSSTDEFTEIIEMKLNG